VKKPSRRALIVSNRRLFKFLIGIAFSAIFLWAIFGKISGVSITDSLKDLQHGWLFSGLASFILGYACRIWRWKVMLAVSNPRLSWLQCAVPFMASIAANNVLPLRAGDAIRAFGCSKWLSVPTPSVFATLLVERILDFLTLILALVLGLGLASAYLEQGIPQIIINLTGAVLIGITATACLALTFRGHLHNLVNSVFNSLSSRKPELAEKLESHSHSALMMFSTLSARRHLKVLIAWSILAWFFEGLLFYSIARSIPDMTNPGAAWLAMSIGTLSTLLPSTPGYVGTFHYFVLSAVEMFGNPTAAAAAYCILVHLALWLPATSFGAFSMLYWMLSSPASVPSIQESINESDAPKS